MVSQLTVWDRTKRCNHQCNMHRVKRAARKTLKKEICFSKASLFFVVVANLDFPMPDCVYHRSRTILLCFY